MTEPNAPDGRHGRGHRAGIVKAYDIRGLVPEEFDAPAARLIGAAFADLTGAPEIAVARDMRATSPALAEAFADGVRSRGAGVVDAGLGSTDYLYFVSGRLGVPGAMFTASHNPAGYNGIKLCRAGAVPVGEGSGLELLRERLLAGSVPPPAPTAPGPYREADLLEEYADHLRSLVDLRRGRPLTVVVDAGNGMAGLTVPLVLDDPSLDVVPLYFELDGTFPHHEADPMKPANTADLRARVRAEGADLGLAFDGDADRCFVVDERGEPVSPSSVIALIAERELARDPGSAIVHNLITSRSAVEVVKEAGGLPVRSRVGHSFVKALMREHDAVFGGEHSGHYYFRDFWFADTGMLAALHVLAALGASPEPLSRLMAGYERLASSGEINVTAADPAAALAAVERAFAAEEPGAAFDRLDGLTVTLPDGAWLNLRASQTEPVVRLNAEAPDPARVTALTDRVLALLGA
ncbi:phosphomannomutase/phosphoglucomutase [Streptomyces sp. NPDC058955]|uniref:phosphomannomutase/phosphoglucomutase n=1 Tax=unclassified Streptomyces TaxID=2593676 RepID=UPI003652030D